MKINPWKFFDWQVKWMKVWLSEKRMERLSIFMLDLGILFIIYTPFSPEPPMIFVMSALSLIFGGSLAVIEAYRQSDDPETQE